MENLANRANLSVEKNFAEQVLVSCTYTNRNGCDGGWYWAAFDYIKKNGIPPETCYPYKANNGICSGQCGSPDFKAKISSFTPANGLWGKSNFNVDDLKGALQDGPLAVAMEVPNSFYSYRSGIYRYTPGEPYSFGHAVLLVGYNDSERYFKVKNSWGSSWGEGGYFRISYDDATSVVRFGSYAATASGIFVEGDSGQIQEITLTNSGTANLNVSSIRSDRSWLSVSPASFSNILPGEQKKISVSVTDWNAILPPQESAYITIDSDDPDESSVKVQVTAMIPVNAGRPELTVSPPFYADSSTDGDILTVSVGNAAGETWLDIANGGDGDMLWTAATSDSWLTIPQESSSGTNSGRVVITYLANTSGSRTGTVTVTSDGALGSPQTVHIYQSDIDLDKDDDGLPDSFELIYGFDSSNPDDAFGDADEDGLTNLEEYQRGTNPKNADTDEDGMTDGYEVQNGSDPLVYDTNLKDVVIGLQILAGMDTNPAGTNADADNDGITEMRDVLMNLRSVAAGE